MSMRVPPWARARVATILLLAPFPAGAIAVAMGRTLARLAMGVALAPGDLEVGVPLFALSTLVLVLIGARSTYVWLGAETDFPRVLRLAPFVGLAGMAIGALAIATR